MPSEETDSVASRLGRALDELGYVRLAFLYGSRARDGARKDSDFDVAVLLDEDAARTERGGMIRRIAGRLGREVSSPLLDLVVLNDASALLRHRILRDGVVLYQRSPEERVRFSIKTIREYQDGQVRRETFTRARIQRLRARTSDGGPGDLLAKARSASRLLKKASSVS